MRNPVEKIKNVSLKEMNRKEIGGCCYFYLFFKHPVMYN